MWHVLQAETQMDKATHISAFGEVNLELPICMAPWDPLSCNQSCSVHYLPPPHPAPQLNPISAPSLQSHPGYKGSLPHCLSSQESRKGDSFTKHTLSPTLTPRCPRATLS